MVERHAVNVDVASSNLASPANRLEIMVGLPIGEGAVKTEAVLDKRVEMKAHSPFLTG
jgi:hypothetical protein